MCQKLVYFKNYVIYQKIVYFKNYVKYIILPR